MTPSLVLGWIIAAICIVIVFVLAVCLVIFVVGETMDNLSARWRERKRRKNRKKN